MNLSGEQDFTGSAVRSEARLIMICGHLTWTGKSLGQASFGILVVVDRNVLVFRVLIGN